MTLLAAEGLHAFYGSTHVLHGVSFALARGETIALMGRNGMGKTTLLRALMGLVPQRRGRVMLGERTSAPRCRRRSRAAVSRSCRRGAASLRRSPSPRTS